MLSAQGVLLCLTSLTYLYYILEVPTTKQWQMTYNVVEI